MEHIAHILGLCPDSPSHYDLMDGLTQNLNFINQNLNLILWQMKLLILKRFSHCDRSRCCELVPREDMNEVTIGNREEWWCEDCTERHAERCEDCRNYTHNDCTRYVNGFGYICNSCIDNGDWDTPSTKVKEETFPCDDCGFSCEVKDLRYSMEFRASLCEYCYEFNTTQF